MGSLASPPPPSAPPPSEGTSLSRCRVYASFCSRGLGINTSICNWIYCYNLTDHTWSPVSSIPGLIENHFLKGFAMASIGDSIYIIGGRQCRKERIHSSVESNDFLEVNREVRSSVLRYDVGTDKWSTCATLYTPRYDFACTVCDNKIYVAGGQSTLVGARGVSSTEMYNPSLDEWTQLPNMNTLRYKCVGVTWRGKIHVVGGFVESTDYPMVRYTDRTSTEVYNEQSGKWDLVPGMWQLDVPPNQIVAVEGRLLSSGDCLNAWKGHIEAYDGQLNLWYMVEGSQLQIPSSSTSTSSSDGERWPTTKRNFLTMAPIGTYLYFLVGYRTSRDSFCTKLGVHVFDTSATGGGWRCLEPIEEEGEKELCSHCCVVQFP